MTARAAELAQVQATAGSAQPRVDHRVDDAADLERRFGGLARLYGPAGYAELRRARFAVVGLGGVGSWAAEALARSGVAELVLIDLDHIAESNINRQVQALTPTLGQAKVRALAERVALIHPGCRVHAAEEFAEPGNWPALLPVAVDALIDACDQVHAKETLARWSLDRGVPIVVAGAAGGKRQPQALQVADLLEVTHDPLLAALRQRLRRAGAIERGAGSNERGKRAGKAAPSGIRCVFSREPVADPAAVAADHAPGAARTPAAPSPAGESADEAPARVAGLNCHGYGSSVMVTATFGFAAAAEAVAQVLAARARGGTRP